MKNKKPVKVKKSKKTNSERHDIVANKKLASAKTEFRMELINALCETDVKIITDGGRVDCTRLIEAAKQNPDIVKKFNDIPDIKLEKALTARVVRREGEVRLEQTLQNIAPIEICRRILIRGGGMVRGKLMSIPDRVSEWCALETDGAKIRERLIQELGDALKSISEQPVEKLIKDTLADK